jgi:hypothetical protein
MMDTSKQKEAPTLPEAKDIVVEAPKGFVTFKRAVQVRPFETATAEVMIQVPTEPYGWIDENGKVDEAKIVADLKPAFFAAKTAVLEQLGLTFEVTPELVVMELLDAELGAVELTESQAQKVAESAAAAKKAKPAADTRSDDPDAPTDKDDLWVELSEHPERYYDNRADKKGNQPDFKRVKGGQGLWLTFRGKTQVPEGVEVPDSGFANSK